MSTKIYNGFYINNLSIKEFDSFRKELQKDILNSYLDKYYSEFSREIEFFIDTFTLLDNEKNFDKIKEILEEKVYHFSNSLQSMMSNVYNMKTPNIITNDNIKNYLNYPLLFSFYEIFKNKLRYSELDSSIFTEELDFDCSMILYPIRGKTLLTTYSKNFTEYLLDNIDKYSGTYGLTEYYYYNNTDKPDNISEKDWNNRRKNWNNIFSTSGLPKKCGINVSILDSSFINDVIAEKFVKKDKKMYEKIINLIPSKEIRQNKYIISSIISELYLKYLNNNNLDDNSYYNYIDFKKSLKEDIDFNEYIILNKEKYFEEISFYSNQANYMIDINTDILHAKIKDIIPNYYNHIKR